METGIVTREKSKVKVKKPKHYKVIMHNDFRAAQAWGLGACRGRERAGTVEGHRERVGRR